jgi:3-oxoacyl-[acyl-carrier protein] reductase
MINPMSMEGKTVIVTGAGQGIGKAIAECVLDLGGNVGVVEFNEPTLKTFTDSHDAKRVIGLKGSVTDAKFAQQAVEDTVKRFGAVHGLVNNAGITRTAMIDKMSQDAWQSVLDVHLTGAFNFVQAVGRHMLERSKAGDKAPGAIVTTSSDAARRGTVGQINYGAAKAGQLGITLSAAREWGRFNIRVNAVCFGIIETQMTETIRSEKFREQYVSQIPVGRWGTVEECAKPVVFLLSDAASYITGQYLSVNGGYTISL